jgi:myo-inositol-1(or 4)-monophosphatase
MAVMDLENILAFVVGLTRQVGDQILRSSRRPKRISYKGKIDLVTQFDRQSQSRLVAALLRRYPDFGILSEENYQRTGASDAKWILDPLDGTTNFAHNLPLWSISVALEVDSSISLGVVYDPNRREHFTALKGKGAFLNRRRIRVSRIKKLDRSLLVTGFPYDIRRSRRNNIAYFRAFSLAAQAVRRLGSAALDLCYTACGRFDGYWEIKLAPWDQAAGSLIVREAGGRVTDFKGRDFSVYGREVIASNGLIHRPMMKVLAGTI